MIHQPLDLIDIMVILYTYLSSDKFIDELKVIIKFGFTEFILLILRVFIEDILVLLVHRRSAVASNAYFLFEGFLHFVILRFCKPLSVNQSFVNGILYPFII